VSLITPEARELIGVDYPPVVYDVDKSAIRLWARAVGYTDPVFYDEEAARRAGHRSIPAPPGFLGHEAYGPVEAIGAKGPPIWDLNPAAPRHLLGGNEIESLAPVCAGDTLVATARITDIEERRGSRGDMLLAHREITFRRDGVPVLIHRTTAITY
jgi:acyl dehydratase